jgi:hypothetical protein
VDELVARLRRLWAATGSAPCEMHRRVTFDGPQGPFRRPETQTRHDALFDEAVILLNGLITNDKFCLSRVSRQKLRHARRPLRVTARERRGIRGT